MKRGTILVVGLVVAGFILIGLLARYSGDVDAPDRSVWPSVVAAFAALSGAGLTQLANASLRREDADQRADERREDRRQREHDLVRDIYVKTIKACIEFRAMNKHPPTAKKLDAEGWGDRFREVHALVKVHADDGVQSAFETYLKAVEANAEDDAVHGIETEWETVDNAMANLERAVRESLSRRLAG